MSTHEFSSNQLSIDAISKVFLEVSKTTLETATREEISYSSIIQKIPKISMKPDLACFVVFNGDYNGLMVINFTANAAVDMYQKYMMTMGMPEDELDSNYNSIEISDSIGEITNQLMGQVIKEIEDRYGLNAVFGQPKALSLNSAITLQIDSDYDENRRLSLKIGNYDFRIEISMEPSEFIQI
ncbi:MAG: DUF3334 family protein [Desulfobacteraceae bacterium]|nr:MAG: DUF3334 family protein [Desulfobacteraceae bacterium]